MVFPSRNVKKLLIIFALVLIGCVGNPVCRHNALYSASVAQEKYQVRMALGYRNQKAHVQAQALINRKWVYIGQTPFGISTTTKDSGFNVVEYMTLEDFVRKWFNAN